MQTLLENIRLPIQKLFRNLALFWKNPKDFLYTYTFSPHKQVHIKPYDPKITKYGTALTRQIHSLYPNLRTHFIGSAALRISGQKDVDFIIDCHPKDFHLYLPGLVNIFGQPKKNNPDFIEWQVNKNGCHIDLLLIDSQNPLRIRTLKTFQILKKHKKLLKQYEKIKVESNGVSIREYIRRRMMFFNQIKNL